MRLNASIVNAFTESPGCGNQAGVVFVEDEISDAQMQKIAFDMNKSETAFIHHNGGDRYSIRWYSPTREVSLCGHATLAASKVIFNKTNLLDLLFAYKDGQISVKMDRENYISMLFPLDEYENREAKRIYSDFFSIDRIVDCIVGKNTKKVVLVVDKNTDLKSIVPNYSLMKMTSGVSDYGIGITKMSERYDFESRYFNPWFGVDEDPVTGSVHTLLANYWGKKLGKNELIAYQDSQRPGELRLKIVDDKVEIRGKAFIFLDGVVTVQ